MWISLSLSFCLLEWKDDHELNIITHFESRVDSKEQHEKETQSPKKVERHNTPGEFRQVQWNTKPWHVRHKRRRLLALSSQARLQHCIQTHGKHKIWVCDSHTAIASIHGVNWDIYSFKNGYRSLNPFLPKIVLKNNDAMKCRSHYSLSPVEGSEIVTHSVLHNRSFRDRKMGPKSAAKVTKSLVMCAWVYSGKGILYSLHLQKVLSSAAHDVTHRVCLQWTRLLEHFVLKHEKKNTFLAPHQT